MTPQISSGNLKIKRNKSLVQPSSVPRLTSLYTNIPHAEGTQPRVQPCLRRYTLVYSSLTSKLLCNRFSQKNKKKFTFMDKHYLRRHETAMGTRMAPSFACLFMSSLEEHMLSTATYRPLIWWRYIDDIFFVWTSDADSLLTFIKHEHSFYSTVKFTSDYSHQQVNFLNVTVCKEHDSLSTDLYKKPTDTHQYLHSSSCHPRHCKSELRTVKHFVFVAIAQVAVLT
ncbi:hypothetical protein BSL78_19243 [Apostichopus japonicus]|uniref:Reverse transcriptase domain-containing protein n=1 Tax=Stichopus japonicus TaxID=307972 RepID=A0A2G8K7I1_STIJA|nr:hypothetical protein BSL78_19243 [Apostichopus japonicus]